MVPCATPMPRIPEARPSPLYLDRFVQSSERSPIFASYFAKIHMKLSVDDNATVVPGKFQSQGWVVKLLPIPLICTLCICVGGNHMVKTFAMLVLQSGFFAPSVSLRVWESSQWAQLWI